MHIPYFFLHTTRKSHETCMQHIIERFCYKLLQIVVLCNTLIKEWNLTATNGMRKNDFTFCQFNLIDFILKARQRRLKKLVENYSEIETYSVTSRGFQLERRVLRQACYIAKPQFRLFCKNFFSLPDRQHYLFVELENSILYENNLN